MNLIKNFTPEINFMPKSKKRSYSIKKVITSFLLICFVASSYFLYNGYTNKVEAYPFELTKDYDKIMELNEKASSIVPLSIESISTTQTTGDKRIITLLRFLQQKNSPMATFSIAKAFVDAADANGFGDRYYILPAISGIESAFGKLIPYGRNGKSSYNGWGWGGPEAGWVYFSSWEDAAQRISKGLIQVYGRNFNPENMVRMYCPPCSREPGQPWVKTVNRYIGEIKSIENTI